MPAFHIDASSVPLAGTRPLLIVDADEVLLLFADGFAQFLAEKELYFDFASYELHGNVRRRSDNTALSETEVNQVLDEFRDAFDSLAPVPGAVEAMNALSLLLDIVVLSNMTPSQAPPRLRNFSAIGFNLPLMINTGLKGPAVKALAQRAGRPVFFVDDLPHHLASVTEEAPDVVRIHLIGDERLKPLRPPAPHADLIADSWDQAAAFIRTRLRRHDG